MRNLIKFWGVAGMLGGLILIGGCSEQGKDSSAQVADVQVTYTEIASNSGDKYIAGLDIEGMACEMMCGNKIAGTLNGLDGVKNTDIEFNGEGEINRAFVEYDNTAISEKEMIAAVNAVANGHYKVKSVNVVHHKADKSAAEEKEEKSDKISYSPRLDYRLPNIFSVFSRLF